MSFVDPRKPPYLIGDNWRHLARAANVETDVLIPESPIDPRPDLASSPEHPDRTDDPEFPYTVEPMPVSEASKEIAEINTKIETQRAEVEAVMASKPLEHSPVIPTAPRREKTLSDYYGVFGPPKRRS